MRPKPRSIVCCANWALSCPNPEQKMTTAIRRCSMRIGGGHE